MAEGHIDGDASSEGSTASAVHQQFSDRPRLWRWRFKHGGHCLPKYAQKIPHFLETGDPESDLGALLDALSLNEHLPEQTNKLAQRYIETKQRLDGLVQEKELLQWHLNNTRKELLLRRCEVREVGQQVLYAKKKITQCKNAKRMYQHEHSHLVVNAAHLESISSALHKERDGVAQELEQWLGRRNDFVHETAQERKFADVERRRRLRQLKKLQLAINRDKRVHVKTDLLRSWDALNLQRKGISEGRKSAKRSSPRSRPRSRY